MRKFLLALLLVASMIFVCEGAWDNTTDFQTLAPAAAIQQIQDNFTHSGGTAGGILMPSGSVFFMFSGSCPTGTTDVTSTYSDKFIRINTTPLATGGADTHSHTLVEANLPPHHHTTAVGGGAGTGYPMSTVGDAGTTLNTSTVGSGTAFTGDNVPAFVTATLCQVD